ncbi:HAMP domain-containing sensor histidine kinase [Porphyromonas pogonae]|uniref:sensor histidine kinase n=1 Tax=Porphyromonas pogonae TaxID=867595 RepID=UPI002E769500|nr:HAMP domain-containing sensor histidine kinase [Porphyromonas pogonae]
MRRLPYSFVFALKALFIFLMGAACILLVMHTYYYTATLVGILSAMMGYSLYRERMRLIDYMTSLIRSIRVGDFSDRFTMRGKHTEREMKMLLEEMNTALVLFQKKLHDTVQQEAETDAWQKLISVLTHEIMNSMTPIISLSDTMRERSSNSPEKDYETMSRAMEIIHRRSEGLLTFINNYRRLTRLPEPNIQSRPLLPVLIALNQLLQTEGIVFDYNVYPETLSLAVDKEMLEQMLINLIRNASEAETNTAKDLSQISVRAFYSEGGVHITVANNGEAIPPDVLKKIFVPFYSTKTNGSGIGLSLCRQIMLRHHGSIAVTTQPGNTTFTLKFPC